MCVFYIPVSVPGLARHAVPLTPSIAASLSWPSCETEHAFSAKIAHAGRTNPLPALPTIALSPLAATLTDLLANVANKRLTDKLTLLDATLTQKPGVGPTIPELATSSLATCPLRSSPFLSYSCALFCTCAKLNPFLFSRFRTLCPKTPGVGVCPTSLFRYLLISLRPETATPFPQRWGQLRKGRTVFRREARVQL